MGIEQLVILILLVVVSVIRWLLEKSAEMREKKAAEQRRQQTGDPAVPVGDPAAAPAEGTRSLDDAQRKLREALGLPPEMDTPRPVERRAEPPPVPTQPAPRADEPRPPVRRPEIRPVPPFVFTEPKPAKPAPERSETLQRKLREYEADLERRLVETAPPPLLPAEPPARPAPRPKPVETVAARPAAGPIEELLRTRDGLRKAVLAQEILGPPKGLVF